MLITVKDIILQSVKLYRENTSLMFKYVGLILASTILIILAGYSLTVFIIFTKSVLLGFGLYFLLVFLLSLFGFIVSISMIKIIASLYQKQSPPNIIPALKSSLSLLIPAILVSIISGLAIIGGFILLIVPGFIFSVWFMFSLHALVLDDKHSTEALKFSKTLVKGRWGEVFWRIVLPTIAFAIIFGIIQWIFKMILGIDEKMLDVLTVRTGIYGAVNIIISALIAPLTTAIATILYIELKKTPVTTYSPDNIEKIEDAPQS